MKVNSNADWINLNDFLVSVGAEQNYENINQKLMSGISELIDFDNFGALLEINLPQSPVPEICHSVGIEKKWIDSYNKYFKKIIMSPPFHKNDITAKKDEWLESNSSEFIVDFLMPQKVHSSICLPFFSAGMSSAFCMILNRSSYLSNFSEKDLSILNIIQPHISNYYRTASLLDKLKRIPVQALELEINNRILSRRESEVIYLLSRRFKPFEIAAELKISVLTVRKHIHNIYEKLNVMNRKELFQKLSAGSSEFPQ